MEQAKRFPVPADFFPFAAEKRTDDQAIGSDMPGS
jgi:hypothetical protein